MPPDGEDESGVDREPGEALEGHSRQGDSEEGEGPEGDKSAQNLLSLHGSGGHGTLFP